jgi:hypothetical protein
LIDEYEGFGRKRYWPKGDIIIKFDWMTEKNHENALSR